MFTRKLKYCRGRKNAWIRLCVRRTLNTMCRWNKGSGVRDMCRVADQAAILTGKGATISLKPAEWECETTFQAQKRYALKKPDFEKMPFEKTAWAVC